MKERTLVLVVYERETIDTIGEDIPEPIRHVPIKTRPTVHRPLPETFNKLARWAAQ